MQSTNDLWSTFWIYTELLCKTSHQLYSDTNTRLSSRPPLQVILVTVIATLLARWAFHCLNDEDGVWYQLKTFVFRTIRRIPYVHRTFEAEYKKFHDKIAKSNEAAFGGLEYVLRVPDEGIAMNKVLAKAERYLQLSNKADSWQSGQHSGSVYNGSNDLTVLTTEVYRMFAWSNPLHTDAFPDIRKMEAEIVRMVCALFNGDSESCGCVTSGGTESIMLACKAYRDRAYARGITQPVMIVPRSAHAAFDKSAELFNIRIKHIPNDPQTFKVDVAAMRRAITRNTCMLVGSACEYARGIVDDIEAIGALGERYGVPVHVDSCLGGFIMAFMERAGFEVAPFDFRVPGVTSISCDTHKYAFAPKGTSTLMYRNSLYRRFQYFSTADWPGGLYATTTFAGSRSGAVIAGCWATLLYFGISGYTESCRKIVTTTRYMAAEIAKIPGIYVLGEPLVSILAFGSNELSIYNIQDVLVKKYKWHLAVLLDPPSVHLAVTTVHTTPGLADRFIAAVRGAVNEVREATAQGQTKSEDSTAAVYGTVEKIPDRTMVNELIYAYLDALFYTGEQN